MVGLSPASAAAPGSYRQVVLVAGATGALLAATQLLGRVWWHDVVFALNGWYVPFDLAIYLDAGDQVLAGRSPYADAAFVASGDYVYPAAAGGRHHAAVGAARRMCRHLWTLAGIGAIVLALVLLGVRDRRCFVLALLFPYTIETLKYGEPGSFLLLLVAVLWRYRDAAAAAEAPSPGLSRSSSSSGP